MGHSRRRTGLPTAVAALALAGTAFAGSTPVAQMVADINPAGDSSPAHPFLFGDRMYFVADDGDAGRELWSTDGTEEGTELVADLNPGPASSDPHDLFAWDDLIWFSATDPSVGGAELFTSDGTPEGTSLFLDIHTGGASDPGGFAARGDYLYFAATDSEHGRELWSTDGSAEGTENIWDLRPGTNSANPQFLTVVGDDVATSERLILVARAPDIGTAVHYVDQDGKVVLLKDIHADGNPNIEEMVLLGHTAIFNADDGTKGNELWKSDGTAAGTALIAEIDTVNDGPGDDPPGSNPTELTVFGNFVYFSADDGALGTELYRANATSASLVRDIKPGSGDGAPTEFCVAGSRLFFSAYTTNLGRELWSTDGTTTANVMDINPGGANSDPAGLVAFGRFVAFAADDGTHGPELWLSDGTAEGTQRITDFIGNPLVTPLAAMGDTLFFSARDGVSGQELWKIEYDVTAPEAIEIASAVQGSPTATEIEFTVVFSEPVTGFNASADVVIVHNGTTHAGIDVEAIDQTTYTVTVSGIAGTGNFTVAVSTASDVVDLNGNPLVASVVSDPFALDSTPPATACTAPAHQIGNLVAITISHKDGTGSDLVSLDVFARRDIDAAWTKIGDDVFESMTWLPPASGRYFFATVGMDEAGNFEAPATGVGDAQTVYNYVDNGPVLVKPAAGESMTVPMTAESRMFLDFRDAAPQGNVVVQRVAPEGAVPPGLSAQNAVDEKYSIVGTFTGTMTMQWTYDPAADDSIPQGVTVDTVHVVPAETSPARRTAAISGTTLTFSGVATFGDFFAGPATPQAQESWSVR